jgi:DNA-binding LytR/AlgR family response regulator
MFNIAICFESRQLTEELQAQIQVLSEEIVLDTGIEVFPDLGSLRRAMDEHQIQLLYLGTRIGDSDGIDFARGLRNEGYEFDVVFCTEDMTRALEAYDVFPAGYLPTTDLNKKKLRDSFRYVAKKHRQKPSIVLKGTEGGKISISVEDILYVEVFRTELDVHTMNHVFVGYGSLVNTYNKLSPRQFYRSHRSFIVNLRFATRIDRYQFTMCNGDRVAIAKNRYAEAKTVFRSYADT